MHCGVLIKSLAPHMKASALMLKPASGVTSLFSFILWLRKTV